MRYALIVILFVLCMPVQAEMSIESVNLHHRNAQEIIPILKPLLAKGGSITGTGYKLFIKSDPENIAQIRHLLGQIDVAAKNLLVSVSMDPAVMNNSTQASTRIHINNRHSKRNADKTTNAKQNKHEKHRIMYDTHLLQEMHTQRAPAVQTVRVSEGLWATIRTGQGIPVATRTRNPDGTVTDTYTYQAVASGFQVLPRVNGDQVTLTIRPQVQSIKNTNNGTYNSTELETTVSGKLGQWIPLGGVSTSVESSGSGIVYHTEQHNNENNRIFVKVELAKP